MSVQMMYQDIKCLSSLVFIRGPSLSCASAHKVIAPIKMHLVSRGRSAAQSIRKRSLIECDVNVYEMRLD